MANQEDHRGGDAGFWPRPEQQHQLSGFPCLEVRADGELVWKKLPCFTLWGELRT